MKKTRNILRLYRDPGELNRDFGDNRLPHKDYARKVAEGEYNGRWHVEFYRNCPREIQPDIYRGYSFSLVTFHGHFSPEAKARIERILAPYVRP